MGYYDNTPAAAMERRALANYRLMSPRERTYRAPNGVETKKRRVDLLLRPSLYAALQAEAARRGVSLNELAGQIFAEAIEAREEQ